MDAPTRNAIRVNGIPWGHEGGEGFYAEVGRTFERTPHTVTAITVTEDLPGLHCSMERVRVWAGEQLIWEGPLHSLEGVTYVAK